MKRIITIDIETLPVNERFESKLFWETEEQYRKTACDANLGRILCIGYCEQDESGAITEHGCFGWREETKDFEPDERTILAEFWAFMRGFDVSRDLVIGHNIMDFDLPFIVQRSIIKGVRPTVDFYFGKYRNAPIFDTMRVWDCWKWGGATSLKKLAFALGLECPKADDIDGSNIYDAYLASRFEEIYRYCMRDVKTTRNAWRKMNFKFPSEKPQTFALTV
ncbi:MAG: ribonuclease H-like domain-containing protein [Acidobacteriota bacterium]|nr:ribonuclease H-like domain-containing protein [Acidobacteriota bacterium]